MENLKEENKDTAILNNNNPLTNIKLSNIPKHTFEDLPQTIQHLANHKAINIIPLKHGTKEPLLKHWKKYQSVRYPLDRIKKHKGNFGVITGNPVNWADNLVILDIDDKKGSEGLYKHFKHLDTLQTQTPFKGYHLYFWSEKPVDDKEYLANLFNLDIELRGKPNIYVTLPKSFVKDKDKEGNIITGSHDVIKEPNSIMNVKDIEAFIKDILIKAGYKPNKTTIKAPVHAYQHPTITGEWIRHLQANEIEALYELLKPLYKEGQRHYLSLYLGGWMYKAEISMNTGLKVIGMLAENDDKQERINTFKNSYRGTETEGLKGSGGIYELITKYIQKENPKEKKSKDLTKEEKIEWDKTEKKRLKTIEIGIKEYYGQIARVIIHPVSMLGIVKTLKDKGNYSNQALRELKRFIETRFKPILDKDTEEIYMYNNDEGYYEEFDNNSFLKFIADMFPELDFFKENTNKVKSGISNLKEENGKCVSFKNGLLNTENLTITEHTHEIFTKAHIPYAYNEEAKSELMETTLKEILIDKTGDMEGDETKYLMFLQIVGYCFTHGNPYQSIFFLHGAGGNGKSVLMGILKHIFGTYASSVPLHNLNEGFGLEGIIGKKVNILYDLPTKPLKDVGNLKGLTGEDSMTIPRKYKSAWNGTPGLKIIGMGNHLPLVEDDSGGFWRRVSVIELINTFKDDERDINRSRNLTNDTDAMEYLIYQAINEYKKIEKNGNWAIPIGTEEMTTEYLKKSNPCLYIAKKLYVHTLDENDYVTREQAVSEISRMLRAENLPIPSNNKKFYDALRNHMGGIDGKTTITIENNRKTVEIIKMIKPIETEKPILNDDMKVTRNNNTSINAEDINKIQGLIINTIGMGKLEIKDIIPDVAIETGLGGSEIENEIMELVDKQILTLESSE